jgi:formate hydrogenlyase transcriptional activator
MSPETSETGTILVVDDTPTNLEVLVGYLKDSNFQIIVATDGEKALERLKYVHPDVILLDVMMPGIDGFETCRRLKEDDETRDIPVIFMTALSETVDKVKGFSVGAVDYITKPFQQEEVLARVQTHLTLRFLQQRLQVANEQLEKRVAERTAELKAALGEVEELKDRLQEENIYLQQEIKLSHNFEEIITQSGNFGKVLEEVEQVAVTDATVLILGETGTGKELLARAVHSISNRKDRPLVKVNCAALPANLIESELFGHEKGAFTGALARKSGRFELADGGTIFLDEIGDLPLELQAKFLRVLQEEEFERLGGTSTIKVDVRVIAATNRDLEEVVAKGDFREDLFYRLNVFPIESPSLRERKEDIPLLVEHFVGKYGTRIGKKITTVPHKVMDALQAYDWPGNVRELENIVERAVIISRGTQFELGNWLSKTTFSSGVASIPTLEEKEREHILEVLEVAGWRVRGEGGAAEILGMKPTTLDARMKKLNIERQR